MAAPTIQLRPSPTLQPFVTQFWWSEAAACAPGSREHVLPTGQMHLVFRLRGPPLRVFAGEQDTQGQVINDPVVGGARSGFYAKEIGASVVSLGAQLRPGAALLLFGVSAAELAGRHTSLCDLWGAGGRSVLEQISAANSPQQQLAALERLLVARLPPMKCLHPAVAKALATARDSRIDELVRSSQYSHRGFIALFKQATGLAPKRYARVMRFQRLLAALRASPTPTLAELACTTGYSDQAHMTREFLEFAGMTPMQYLQRSPAAPHHVALSHR
jgi:AraC-like DNA-binding protein